MISTKNRIVRLATALSVAGLISAQIPMSGGTALAADGYHSSGQFLGTGLTNEQVFSGATIGLLGIVIVNNLKHGSAGGDNAAVPPVAAGPGPAAAAAPGMKIPLIGDGQKPIYDVVAGDPGDFSAIKGLIDDCGELIDPLRNQGPFTFFAPDNGTLGAVPAGDVSTLRANKESLCDMLKKHTVIGRYRYEDLMNHVDKNLLTLSGETVRLTHQGGKAFIDGKEVAPTDIAASNGWIHSLRGILNGK